MNVRIFTKDVPNGELWQMDAVPRIGDAIMADRGNGTRPVRVRDVIWDQSGMANVYVQG